MGKLRNQTHATPCEHCGGTGKEPRSGQHLCSVCLGVQYVDAETGEWFDDFTALRFLLNKLLPKKDHRIKKLQAEVNRLQHVLVGLKPYMEAKEAAELAEKVYPKERSRHRANNGIGGFGD
jgi:hypothetical protein